MNLQALCIAVFLVLVSCWSPTIMRYPPDLDEHAVLATLGFQEVESIWESPDGRLIYSKKRDGTVDSFHLAPGEYMISYWGQGASEWPTMSRVDRVILRAGRTYSIWSSTSGWFWEKRSTVWIVEDGGPVVAGLRHHTCGNGYIDQNEDCDDGNFRSGDGCSRGCQLEANLPE